MCLASFLDRDGELTDKEIALYWWISAFNNNYDNYLEALHPWDIESQDNFRRNSKEYANLIECIIKKKSSYDNELFYTMPSINEWVDFEKTINVNPLDLTLISRDIYLYTSDVLKKFNFILK